MNLKNLSKAFLFLVAFIVFGFIATVVTGKAGEGTKEKSDSVKQKASEHDYDTMTEKWKEFATPNENHKVLGTLVGNWDYTVKWWMSPDAKPEVSKGTSEIEWIMGGRYIEHTTEGTSMGQPFEGMGIIGYDNEKEQYQSIWVDNMGTGIMTGSGDYDPSTRTLTDRGTFSCPAEGQKSYRGVTKIINQDNFTYEWYMAGPDKKEFRAMEIVYTRKK
ncbi:MAG TPA: DUF1579 domain-containing protein [Thermodesulfobacteriota bacterium]|nr:DUF1579 domain-containing protein [Thermodesulfobacteriota bacterium]